MSQGQFCTKVISAYLDKARELEVVKLQTHEIEKTNRKEKLEKKICLTVKHCIQFSLCSCNVS